MATECPTPAAALKMALGEPGEYYSPQLTKATPANSRSLTFPPQPWIKANLHEDGPMNKPARS